MNFSVISIVGFVQALQLRAVQTKCQENLSFHVFIFNDSRGKALRRYCAVGCWVQIEPFFFFLPWINNRILIGLVAHDCLLGTRHPPSPVPHSCERPSVSGLLFLLLLFFLARRKRWPQFCSYLLFSPCSFHRGWRPNGCSQTVTIAGRSPAQQICVVWISPLMCCTPTDSTACYIIHVDEEWFPLEDKLWSNPGHL